MPILKKKKSFLIASLPNKNQTRLMTLRESWSLEYHREPNLYALINLPILAYPVSFHCTDVTEFTHQRESQLHRWLEFQVDEAHFTQKLCTMFPTCTTPSRVFRELSSARVHMGMGSSREYFVIFSSWSHVAIQHQTWPCPQLPTQTASWGVLSGPLVRGRESKEQGHHPHKHLQDKDPVWTQQSHSCF